VVVGAPTRDAGTLLSLLRVALETTPARAPVTALVVRAHASRTRAAQLGLFEPAGPSPDKLATLLARLQATVGEGRVGAPALVDRHLPDAFAIAPFAPKPSPSPSPSPSPRPLALHAYRPPRRAEARLERGRLRYLAAEGVGGQVVHVAGPFRVRDGWWQHPIERDYFDVELTDGAIYRVYLDRRDGGWHVDGCYE
jgi:protein ImuB